MRIGKIVRLHFYLTWVHVFVFLLARSTNDCVTGGVEGQPIKVPDSASAVERHGLDHTSQMMPSGIICCIETTIWNSMSAHCWWDGRMKG